jgi:hypothetical protein
MGVVSVSGARVGKEGEDGRGGGEREKEDGPHMTHRVLPSVDEKRWVTSARDAILILKNELSWRFVESRGKMSQGEDAR